MKPVAILRYAPQEGPGYFATYLSRRRIPWHLVKLDEGAALPRPHEVAGLAMLGGAMSVNDDLPWIPRVTSLIRAGVAAGIPVLGHCLGGQLMSKALGGKVGRNPVKEIGWGEIEVADNPVAREWLGPDLGSFESFHWHGETFSIPEGAVRIMGNRNCENQGFVVGKSLGMQCHVEMTEELVASWLKSGADEIRESSSSPGVQKPEEIEKGLQARLAAMHEVANRLYDRWTKGLSPGN